MVLVVLATILVGLMIALPATAALVRLGERLNTLDSQGHGGHVKELRRIPNIGGVAIFAAVAIPMAIFLIVVGIFGVDTLAGWVPVLEPYRERIRENVPAATALLACLIALHSIGLIDDRKALGPFLKLGVQLATATFMVIAFDVRLLTFLDRIQPLGPVPSILISILWITLVTNAINFLDNMDGLAAGVAAISGTLFMAAALLYEQWFIAAVLGLMIGGLVGFLRFNFPPARIFMGDGGSLVIGFLLGVLTARTTFFDEMHPWRPLSGGWYGVFMPIVVLAVPIYDFTSVTLIRLRQGKSPFVGDQQHFSHRLVQRGLTRRGAVLVIWAIAATTGIGGIVLGSLAGWQAILIGVQTILVLLVLASLEYASRHAVKA